MAPHALKRRKLDQTSGHEGHPSAAAVPTGGDPHSGAFDNGGGTALTATNPAGAVRKSDLGGDGEGAAGNTYNSNMFKLQMDELLAETRPDYERRLKKAEKALRRLKTILERIPEQEPLPVSSTSKTCRSGPI